MKKLLFITGTRPEAIKVSPVLLHFRKMGGFSLIHCHTNQHHELATRVFEFFGLAPDIFLNWPAVDRSLATSFAGLVNKLEQVMEELKPDAVMVQGDTSSACAGAMSGFYHQVPVFHIEAGLRTGNIYEPFPEEMHRKLISALATLHFSPTRSATDHLRAENIAQSAIYETGNTGIDALLAAVEIVKHREPEEYTVLKSRFNLEASDPVLLITVHRRENIPQLDIVLEAIEKIAGAGLAKCLVSVHPNPNVRAPVTQKLAESQGVYLIDPPNYGAFVALMQRVDLILTDSGGIQEEAPYLGTPVLVLRNFTERTEGIEQRAARLVEINAEEIVGSVEGALRSDHSVAQANLYGDGSASGRIYDACRQYFSIPD